MKMILSITAVVSLFGATAALACNSNPPPNCSCKNNQWVNNTTNQVWNSNTNNYNTNVNNSVNKSTNVNGVNGNVGSTSSATSTATGGQGGAGGSVSGSGNSTNTNNVAGGSATIAKGAVTNSNSQTQTATGGTSSVTGSGNSSIAAGAVSNTVGSSSVASNNGSNNTTSASADGAGANNGNNSNNTSVTFEAAKTYRQPVATAYAASLTSGFDTCLGSVSGGAQTQILGLSIGGTKTDKNCVLIKQTQLLREMNLDGAACFRARMGKEGADIDSAMRQAGVTCQVVVIAPPVVVTVPGPERIVIQEVPAKKTGQ